ncbi:MAG: helix-turn-helix transcriptional regulator [Thermoleophilia bacterium]|nr:helix-turn-helix transcriptional regulator [Thermoleophilia bacterium]
MSDNLTDLMHQIESEAVAEGPTAIAELNQLNVQFRLAADLFARRRALGMSQAALSAACGVPQADISRIERGQANPTLATVERLVNALGGSSMTITWKAS